MSTSGFMEVNGSDTPFFNRRQVQVNVSGYDKALAQMKQGVWLYFLLLVFEGALRKWFLPGLATPLLLVRDPIAIWLVYKSWQNKLFPAVSYVLIMMFIGIVSIYTAVFLGHGNIVVAFYGARIMLFQFPLIFVIGKIFDHDDVVKLGKVLLYLSIPMTILIVLQFYSPQSAWVNRGVGGDMAGAGFTGALEYFRPPGTFSFTNGTALFYSLVCCFVLYFWINHERINQVVLIVATVCMLAAIPLSISRSLFFQSLVSLLFCFIAISRKPEFMGRMILAVLGGVVAIAFLSRADFFSTAVHAFSVRFETANDQEGGVKGVLGGRYLGSMFYAFDGYYKLPFFGYGIGMGSNVGSMLLAGNQNYLIAEEEWPRLIGELGAVMGVAVIFVRIALCIKFLFKSYSRLIENDFLPWMLSSFGLLVLSHGQWAQPTALGFCIFISGLIMASFNKGQAA